MSTHSTPTFSDEERQLLTDAPYLVFLIVAGADGDVGRKEADAFHRALVAAAAAKHPVLHDICAEGLEDPVAKIQDLVVRQAEPISMLQRIATVLDGNLSSNDAATVKVALIMIGKHVAEASGGGFLGLGKKINKDEKIALAVIIQCLGFGLEGQDAA